MNAQTQRLKLGTRRSWLALTQSQWVADHVERLNPGFTVELVEIETRGDKILDKPLNQIEGKEFFTAELDHALLKGEVDFTVHSLKDLSTERPTPFCLAAVPERTWAHDVLVLNREVFYRGEQARPLMIGTSSPRRNFNLRTLLPQLLPEFSRRFTELQFKSIRGNVNTRIGKIDLDLSHPDKVDGVILAYAGINRLLGGKFKSEFEEIFKNKIPMLIPLSLNPTAPAQGALGVECLSAREDLRAVLGKLDHADTRADVTQERAVLTAWGGGCHQKLGASVIRTKEHKKKLVILGQKPSGEFVSESHPSIITPEQKGYVRVKIAGRVREQALPITASQLRRIENAPSLFCAHRNAILCAAPEVQDLIRKKCIPLFTPGVETWRALSQAGFLGVACTEGLGVLGLQQFNDQSFFMRLNIPSPSLMITVKGRESAHPGLDGIATYEHQLTGSPLLLPDAPALFWPSGMTFETVFNDLNEIDRMALLKKKHACFQGKTGQTLMRYGITPEIFEWSTEV